MKLIDRFFFQSFTRCTSWASWPLDSLWDLGRNDGSYLNISTRNIYLDATSFCFFILHCVVIKEIRRNWVTESSYRVGDRQISRLRFVTLRHVGFLGCVYFASSGLLMMVMRSWSAEPSCVVQKQKTWQMVGAHLSLGTMTGGVVHFSSLPPVCRTTKLSLRPPTQPLVDLNYLTPVQRRHSQQGLKNRPHTTYPLKFRTTLLTILY